MKNILVTGGAGYIGSHIIELLVKKKFNTFILDNFMKANFVDMDSFLSFYLDNSSYIILQAADK